MHNENRPGKNGNKHSCLFIIAIGAFAGLVGLLLAYHGFKAYVISDSTKDLSPAEKKEFLVWAHTPEDLTNTQPGSAVQPELLEAKEGFKTAVFATDGDFPEIRGSANIASKIHYGKPLTTDELDIVSSYTKAFKPIILQGRSLVEHEGYAFNNQQYPAPPRSIVGWTAISSLLSVYIHGCIVQDNWDAAIEGLDLVADLSRCESGVSLMQFAVSCVIRQRAYRTISYSIDTIPDSNVLVRLVNTLNGLKVEHDQLSLVNLHPWLVSMKQDGYVSLNQITPAQVRSLNYGGYLEWLTQNLIPESPRRLFASTELQKYQPNYGSGPAAGTLKRIDAGLTKPVIRPLIAVNSYPEVLTEWKFYKEWQQYSILLRVHIDLLQLHLAIQIVNDYDIPTDIRYSVAAQYLKPVSKDPFGSGTYNYSASEGCYYSVGPDGVAGTGDDIMGFTGAPVSGD